jgi:hypothetical protein
MCMYISEIYVYIYIYLIFKLKVDVKIFLWFLKIICVYNFLKATTIQLILLNGLGSNLLKLKFLLKKGIEEYIRNGNVPFLTFCELSIYVFGKNGTKTIFKNKSSSHKSWK